ERRQSWSGGEDAEQVERVGSRDRELPIRGGSPAHLSQQADGLGRGKLFAGKAFDEAATADVPARLEPPAGRENLAPGRKPARLSREQPPEEHAPPLEQCAHEVLD